VSGILIAVAWCAAHFLVFLVQRGTGALNRERAIFLFHAIPFAVFLMLLVAALVAGFLSFAEATGALSVHGIYSLTFLEFWSLAQGGYTVSLLRLLVPGPMTQETVLHELSLLGEKKREDRLLALECRKLIRRANECVTLTKRGKLIARVVLLLRWLSNAKATG
jgi:hypothetical protein